MKTTLTAILLLFSIYSFGQNAYYDAQNIARIDVSELQDILDHAGVHLMDAGNNFVQEKDVKLQMIGAGRRLTDTEIIECAIDDNDCIMKFRMVGDKTRQEREISLRSLALNDELQNDFSLTEAASGIDVKMVNGYSLSEPEKKHIRNLIAFVDSPFDQGLTEIDLKIVNDAIDKYNGYAKKRKMSVKKPVGFAASSLAGAAPGLIGGILSGDFSMSEEDQTKIIDGLVKYIAEEFRRAQMMSYMNIFERTIGQIGEFQVLFPKTFAKLKATDPIKFPDLGDEFKEIFSQDFKSLLDNLLEHFETHTASSDLEDKLTLLDAANITQIKATSEYESFKIAIDASSKLIHNYHPVDLFHYLDGKYYANTMLSTDTELENKIGFYLHGLNLLQRNVLDTAKTANNRFSNVWLNYEQLKKLDSPVKVKYFLALIYQQDRTYFNRLLFPAKTDAQIAADITLIQGELKKKVDALVPILIELQDFRANLDDQNLKDNFEDYIRMVLDVVEAMTQDSDNLKTFFAVADDVVDVYENVRDKDFGNTIFHLNEILRVFVTSIDGSPQILNILSKIDHYGSFMAAVVNAENSDDMKEVIKSFVAPPASYVFKRQHNWTMSVTAHPGYFVGFEANKEFPDPKVISGLTLPIGFDLNYKLNRNSRDQSATLGFSGQILDLGAVLNFRIMDSTSTLPDVINFKQFFSPGFSINYGLANSPLTIALGYQYTPELRKITLDNGNELFPNYHRVSLRLSWDLPLLFLYKSKKYCKYDFKRNQ